MENYESVVPFVEAAKSYVDMIESRPPDSTDFLRSVEGPLARLVASAIELPDAEPTLSEPAPRDTRVPEGLLELIGDADIYWDIFDPAKTLVEPEVGAGSLTDDLGDVYLDLKRGLALWDRALAADAVWEWKFGFQTHWGLHAIRALRVIHCRLY